MKQLKARNLNMLVGSEMSQKVFKHEQRGRSYDIVLIKTPGNSYMVVEIHRGDVKLQHHHGFDYEEASHNFDEIIKNR